MEDVFAVGDCAGFLEQTGRPVLPALAQVKFIFFFSMMLLSFEPNSLMKILVYYMFLKPINQPRNKMSNRLQKDKGNIWWGCLTRKLGSKVEAKH